MIGAGTAADAPSEAAPGDAAWKQRAALVTGASRGIGRAIALAFAVKGVGLCLAARSRDQLEACAEEARRLGARDVLVVPADLAVDGALRDLADAAQARFADLDILVHAAGGYERGRVDTMSPESFDEQYRTNLRAPYLLTQRLLTALRRRGGDIVFINSTQGAAAGAELSQYAATRHGLKAFADSLREEVNADGVRVLTLYLGRTATPLQERIFAQEGRRYQPEKLMQPEDVATMVAAVLSLPRRAEALYLTMRSAEKSY